METLTCPSLFLLGAGEAAELRRQTEELAGVMQRAGADVTVHRFDREEGDAHCQVTNLALAHLVVFDWLDRVLPREPGPRRAAAADEGDGSRHETWWSQGDSNP